MSSFLLEIGLYQIFDNITSSTGSENSHDDPPVPLKAEQKARAIQLQTYQEENLFYRTSSNSCGSQSVTQYNERGVQTNSSEVPDRTHVIDLVERDNQDKLDRCSEREVINELHLLGSRISDFALNVASEFDNHRSIASEQILSRQDIQHILQQNKFEDYLVFALGNSLISRLLNYVQYQQTEIVTSLADAVSALGSAIVNQIISTTYLGLPREGEDVISGFKRMTLRGKPKPKK